MKTVLNLVLSAAVGAAAVSGCALFGGRESNPKMNASPSNPAAEGIVTFTKAGNDNTGIELTVKHLAEPEKLTPPAHNYVVWIRANKSATPQNVGALSVDKNLVGKLNTVTALHTFDLFVTGETTGAVQQPTGEELLWTSHNQ